MPSSASDSRLWMELADGRRLAYTATGPPDGHPVLYCHGAIGTPIDASIDLTSLMGELGVRYIAPSRPGIGGSDPHQGRSILSHAEDVRQLVDDLGVGRFSVIGVSAGGPYALAVSHLLRNRVRRVAAVSSLSPLYSPHQTPGLRRRIRYPLATLHTRPDAVRRLGDALLPLVTANPALVSRIISAHAAPSERARLAEVGERMSATASFLDSCADGVGGLVEDYGVYAGPWRFDPAEVYSPVDLWHGAADPLVPVEHALALAAMLPHCTTYLHPEEGHHFFRARLPVILEQLLAGQAQVRLQRASRSAVGARSSGR